MTGVLIREAPISRETFMQGLKAATENRALSLDGDTVTIDNGRITVRLTTKERPGEGPTLLLADFAFENMSDEDVRMFMEHYDRVAQDVVGS